MSVFLKFPTPGPTLDVERFIGLSTPAILQILENEGIYMVNDESVDYATLRRDKPTAKLEQRCYVPTAPVIRSSTLLQGLQDADADSYLEAMAALALYLNQEEEGPDALFCTLLAKNTGGIPCGYSGGLADIVPGVPRSSMPHEEAAGHVYCAVRRLSTRVTLEFYASLPADWQEGHTIKGSDMVLVGFKEAKLRPVIL